MEGSLFQSGSPNEPVILSQIDTDPGYKRVAKAIEIEIVAGRLKVGDILPTEGQLAQQLGVHRSTVREGIRSLENAALVRRAGGKRLVVSIPEPEAIAWVNTRALGMMQVSFTELWEMQMELEPFAAQKACDRLTDTLAEALRANVTRLRERLDDDDFVGRSDIEFHRLIAEAANNSALSLIAAPIGLLLFSATVHLYQTVPQARHRLLAAHEAILNAILARDNATAKIWMARHIQDFRRGYEVAGFKMNEPIQLKFPPIDNVS